MKKFLNMSEPSDRLQLQAQLDAEAKKAPTGNVKTVAIYPNMTTPDKVFEPRSELPPEAILVAVGDSHPMKY